MPEQTIYQQLCTAIDQTNVARINDILTQYPNLDLNHITPNGLSALWWAVFPPNGTKPSLLVMQTLLGFKNQQGQLKIDILQTYQGIKLKDFLTHYLLCAPYIYTRGDEKITGSAILNLQDALQEIEDQWVNERRGARHTAQPPLELKAFVLDSQNTHDRVLVKEVDEAIIALYQRYQSNLNNPSVIQTQFTSLKQTLTNETGFSPEKILLIETALERIECDSVTREYHLDVHRTITLSLTQVLYLMVFAAKDLDKTALPAGRKMAWTEEDVKYRLRQLLHHLYLSQTTYEHAQPACWMGTRNQIVIALSSMHRNIVIEDKSKAILSLKAIQLMASEFEKRTFEEQWSIMRGSLIEDEIDNADDDFDLQAFNEFKKYLSSEEGNAYKALDEMVDGKYITLNDVQDNLQEITLFGVKALKPLLGLYYLTTRLPKESRVKLQTVFKALFKKNKSFDETYEQCYQYVLAIYEASLTEWLNHDTMTSLSTPLQYLKNSQPELQVNYIKHLLDHDLQINVGMSSDDEPPELLITSLTQLKNQQSASTVSTANKTAETSLTPTQQLLQKAREQKTIEEQKNRLDKADKSLLLHLFLTLLLDLKNEIPEHIKNWFKTLPLEFQHEASQLYWDTTPLSFATWYQNIPTFVLQTGHFQQLNLEGFDLSSLDLRCNDLRGVNLKNVNLANSDLSGILIDEKTDFTGANCNGIHLSRGSLFETILYNQTFLTALLNTSEIFLDGIKVTPQQWLLTQDHWDYTPLMVAAMCRKSQIAKSILASSNCTYEMLTHKNMSGETTYDLFLKEGEREVAGLIKFKLKIFKYLKGTNIFLETDSPPEKIKKLCNNYLLLETFFAGGEYHKIFRRHKRVDLPENTQLLEKIRYLDDLSAIEFQIHSAKTSIASKAGYNPLGSFTARLNAALEMIAVAKAMQLSVETVVDARNSLSLETSSASFSPS